MLLIVSEGRQVRHSKSGLLGIPHSMTANQGAHFTAKEVEQEPKRHAGRLLTSCFTSQFTLSFLKQFGTTCSGLGPPTAVKNPDTHPDVPTGQSDPDNSLR